MKIYCSREDKLNFDYWVGKPFWVKVTNRPKPGFVQHYWWLMFLSKVNNKYGEFYTVHSLPDVDIKDPYNYNYINEELTEARSTVWELYPFVYEIVTPIECIHDSELGDEG